MGKKIDAQKLMNKAEMIADLIDKTDIEYRGVLFIQIATILIGRSQNYTASLIAAAGKQYGFPVNPENKIDA